MNAFHAVAPVRLYRLIADQIAQRIRQGDFAVGARLPAERDLAEQLQVSRASVREALIALEIEGYVDVRVGTGVFVCAPPAPAAPQSLLPTNLPKNLPTNLPTHIATHFATHEIGPFDLLATRLLLEPECAALAAEQADATQLAAIRTACAALPAALSQAPLQYDVAFHAALAAACGNAALAAAIAHLRELSAANPIFSRLDQHMVSDAVWVLAHQEHERIVAAIAARDAHAARAAMREHLQSVQARLREDFDPEVTP